MDARGFAWPPTWRRAASICRTSISSIHADLPNDAEVMQHRSGRTGRAGRKGVSVLLVPPARKRRAELLLNLAGIDAIWGTAPTAEEIRKLDQERMLQDTLFAQETTADDLVLARAMLAERSPEDIAAALARLYRARLPSPEDMLDPGQGGSRSRDDRGREKDGRAPRGEDRDVRTAIEAGKIIAASRHGGRQRVVSRRHRQAKERGSALAAADDLPPRRHRQERHRRHPHHGHHHRVRDFQRGRGNPSRSRSSARTRKTISGSNCWKMARRLRRLRKGTTSRAARPRHRSARRVRTIDPGTSEDRSHTASSTAKASRDSITRRTSRKTRSTRTSRPMAGISRMPVRRPNPASKKSQPSKRGLARKKDLPWKTSSPSAI